jgi:hypothetical protein
MGEMDSLASTIETTRRPKTGPRIRVALRRYCIVRGLARAPRQMRIPMAAEPDVAVQPAARGAGLVGQHQRWSVDGFAGWACLSGIMSG